MALDLEAITAKWLQQCGPCDAGLPVACSHPQGDYRPVMLDLVREVERLTAANADLTDRLGRTLHELREVAGRWDRLAAQYDDVADERDAASAALAAVSDLLDEARSQRDAARAELLERHPGLPVGAIDFRRIIAQRIDSYLDPNEPDGLLHGPDVIAEDIVNAISAAFNWPHATAQEVQP